jgi:hypothetical protein
MISEVSLHQWVGNKHQYGFFPNILIMELHGRLLQHNEDVPHMKTQTTRNVKYVYPYWNGKCTY